MLASIIKDDELKFIYLNKSNDVYKISGWEVNNKSISNLSKKSFSFFSAFVMSKNNKYIGEENGYEVFYDTDNGFYHYFKNKKEDYFKFYINNGENITCYESEGGSKNKKNFLGKKFICAFGTIIISSFLTFNIIMQYYNGLTIMNFKFNDETICVKVDETFDKLNINNEEEELTFIQGSLAENIKKTIYSSSRLTEEEKIVLYNDEFIKDIIPYYKDNIFEYGILARCFELAINPYHNDNDSEKGHYNGGNEIFVKDYDPRKINDFETKNVVAHELVHLFQALCPYPLISEPSAEIISQEYFLNSADNSLRDTYYKAIKHLKILMEIIGTEPVRECNFKYKSTLLEDSVKPYLSESEYLEFISLISLSPSEDAEKLENGGYIRYYELLSIIYYNKYGKDISEDEIISVINSDTSSYYRPYFRKSMVLNSQSYYIKYKTIDLLEAESKNLVRFYKYYEEEKTENLTLDPPYTTFFSSRLGSKNGITVLNANIEKKGTFYSGNVEIIDENGEQLTLEVNEAIKKGYIIEYYKIQKEVTGSEYINFYNLAGLDYRAYTQDGYKIDNQKMKVLCLNDYDIIYIPSIDAKENDKDLNRSILS